MDDLLVSTMNDLPGYSIDEVLGEVFGLTVRSRNVGSQIGRQVFNSARSLALVGGITLSQIRRGVAQTGTLGYWIGQPFTGRGFASAAVAATMTFAFERLALHRVEAACLPDNLRSQRVLEKQRFVREGLASSYLKINGIWRDHLLYGRVAP